MTGDEFETIRQKKKALFFAESIDLEMMVISEAIQKPKCHDDDDGIFQTFRNS